MRKSLTLLALLWSSPFLVLAQAPYLVKDLATAGAGDTQSSGPVAFISSGGTLFFVATTDANGQEPWVRDANGTRLLRDINPGVASARMTGIRELTPGVVLFTADDGVNGRQLWRSDGTEAGTTLVKVVNATTSPFFVTFAYGGKAFFSVDDGVHGHEPWVTDGTSAGTQLLADTIAGTPGNTVSARFFRFSGTMRFFAAGGIWTTDGTPAGTTLGVPVTPYYTALAVTSNAIYFFGYDAAHGFEPWKSDGTPAGTAMIRDVRSGTGNSVSSGSIAPTATGAVFVANDGSGGGDRLWSTDGTFANTVLLDAFPASPRPAISLSFTSLSQGVFFSAETGVWRTDGTQAGTYMVSTLDNGSFGFTEAFGKIYFSSWYEPGPEPRLFQIDGSPSSPLVSVRPDIGARDIAFTGGKLWFAGSDAANGSELWVSDDGTTTGTHLVTNIAPDFAPSSRPVNLTAGGPFLYFHPASPTELWRSDGTSAGTVEATDVDSNLIVPPPFGELTPYHGDIYYLHGHSDLFRVDGVNGGATQVGGYDFDYMTADASYIYMWSSFHVLRSDGTAAGTIELYDPSDPTHLRGIYDDITVLSSGDSAWIRCSHGLYRTAGTLETTRRIVALPANTFFHGDFAIAGGLLYSQISTSATGRELWRSDGTSGGALTLKDANPGGASSSPANFTPAGRLLFFTANDGEHGIELWRSDGTAAGTFMVKDTRSGSETSSPAALTAIGETIYFSADDGTSGTELWKSDGTEAGTVRVRDISPGPPSSKPVCGE